MFPGRGLGEGMAGETGTGDGHGRGLDPGLLLDRAFAQSAVRISLYDNDIRYVRMNQADLRALGLKDESAVIGRRPAELSPDPGFGPAHAASFEAAARRAIATGEHVTWQTSGEAGSSGQERAWLVSITPVRDGGGVVCGALAVTFEVTERDLARQRLALVNEASKRIGSTLELARTAAELAEVAVPGLADVAMIDIQESVLRGDEPVTGPAGDAVLLRRMAFRSVLAGAPEIVVGLGQVAAYPPGSSAARALASGMTVIENPARDDFRRWEAGDPARSRIARQFGFHSFMAVPLRARGAMFGVAVFIRHQRPGRFTDDDLALAEEIVARAAVCIDNARRYTREHATALALQHSLLQNGQPAQGAVAVATRYLPGQAGVTVGGDWLDVIELSGSRVGLVAGDVAGHGIHAAATMGQLRTAVRTLADLDLEPEELLTRLDDVVTRMADEHSDTRDLTATCLFAVYDPVTRCCTLARAGHPAPAVMTPGSDPEYLDLPAGPPLGVGGVPFEERQIELPEGSLLVMFTDGLVESRDRDIDAGLTALLKALSQNSGQLSLETVCDRLTQRLIPGPAADDDAALLIARTAALPFDRVVSWDLPADPAVVAESRARAACQLAAWNLQELTPTTELLVSELVTNAIRHAQPPIQLRMILDTALHCEVSDASVTAPRQRRADRYDEDGRGLMLVARLAKRWGTRYTQTGKTIWAQQPLTNDTSKFT
jgi:serine phosphatase RsbU (regulator of sigma subunit)/anti-sigma regulatory factor (Ser/Thr protein kinase)